MNNNAKKILNLDKSENLYKSRGIKTKKILI